MNLKAGISNEVNSVSCIGTSAHVFTKPPKEILLDNPYTRGKNSGTEEQGFDFLHIANREKEEGSCNACRLVMNGLKDNALQERELCTVELPSSALTINANSSEKVNGKVGKIQVHDDSSVIAIINGNEYDVFGFESFSAKEIIAVITGSEFGSNSDDGVYIGRVLKTLRFVPKV